MIGAMRLAKAARCALQPGYDAITVTFRLPFFFVSLQKIYCK
jgi:hypothetical protein